jgi:hypothetical protein
MQKRGYWFGVLGEENIYTQQIIAFPCARKSMMTRNHREREEWGMGGDSL